MGVEYERWLIAKGNFFSPSAASVAKLVERLRKEKWIVDPSSPEFAKLRFQGTRGERAKTTGGYAVRTVENTFGKDLVKKIAATTESLPVALDAAWIDEPDREELRLVWPVDCEGPSPCTYPLTRKPEGNTSYALEIHRCLEYVYPTAETIGLIPSLCRCGEDLAFEWDDEELVPAFGASIGIFTECEACSRTFEPVKGSAVITNPFDKSSAQVAGGAAYLFALKIDCGECFVADAGLAFAPALVELVANEFGRDFYEVGCVS